MSTWLLALMILYAIAFLENHSLHRGSMIFSRYTPKTLIHQRDDFVLPDIFEYKKRNIESELVSVFHRF